MKKFKLNFALMLIILSSCEHTITPLIEEIKCFEYEEIDTINSGVKIFLKGPQKSGKAIGYKESKFFEASASMNDNEGLINIGIITYWQYDSLTNFKWGADYISIKNLNIDNEKFCFELIPDKNNNKEESKIEYTLLDGDTPLYFYELDTSAINQLEILEINKEEKKLKALFKATFVTKTPWEPEFPEKVRFTNTEIEIGY